MGDPESVTLRLINKTDDAHLPLTLRTGQGVCLIDFSDEVGPSLTESAPISKALRALSADEWAFFVSDVDIT